MTGTIRLRRSSVRVKTPNYDYYYLCTELRRAVTAGD